MKRFIVLFILPFVPLFGEAPIGMCGKTPFTPVDVSPMATPFFQLYREVVNGDFVAGGCALSSGGSCSITISGIPAGSSVVKAYLFWVTQGSVTSGVFNGTPITGTLAGSDCSSCWGGYPTNVYYADVTPYVSGNGTYSLSSFGSITCGGPGPEGAALIVVYGNGAETKRTITVYTGAWEWVCSGNYTWTHTGFTATNPVTSAKYLVAFGNGQNVGSGGEYVYLNGNLITNTIDGSTGPGSGPCGNGSLWDVFQGSATSWIPGGATSATFSFNNSAAADCWHITVSVLSVSSDDALTYTCAAGYDDPVLVDESKGVYYEGDMTVYSIGGSVIYKGKGFVKLPKGVYFIRYKDGVKKVLVR
ncbi:MAG: DUF3344 domain-containing protein [candidate division WOR-3 bacterium]